MSRTAIFQWTGRGVGWLLALAASSVLVLNFERVAIAHRLDQLIPDPGKASGLFEFTQRPMVILAATLVLGVLTGFVASKVKAVLTKRIGAVVVSGQALGARMLMCAEVLSGIQRWSSLHSDQDRRNALAQLNIAILDAHRFGLHTPAQGAPADDMLNYLTEVGSWLMKGDKEVAKMRAKIITGDRGLPGA